MDFTIYSIGDSAFLEQILISVASIFGTNSVAHAAGVFMLLGVIGIFVQSIAQGSKQIDFQQVLLGWVIYAVCFIPTVNVKIEDGIDGTVRPVNNVPLGVGITGGVISNVGYELTNLFQVGFGAISNTLTQTSFAESLKIINEIRRKSSSTGVFSALSEANGGNGVDVRRSVDNYIRECTLTKIDLGLETVDGMLNKPIPTAFAFNSSLYGTRLYLSPGNPDGVDYTCNEAWALVNNAIGQITSNNVTEALAVSAGFTNINGAALTGKVSDSLQALSQYSTDSFTFIRASILEPLYFNAVMGKYQDLNDFGSAIMVNQAIQQRNMQWATEQTLFMSSIRPMMAFFEGFIYAITPIMAVLVVFGSKGLSLAGKYLQTIIWIQLWMPVLAIVNLYIHTAATRELEYLKQSNIDSLYTLNATGDIMSTWIATGGAMAAATPMISMFIVTASSYAFASLAQRVSGSDHIDEKIGSPDVAKGGSLTSMQPMYAGNATSGFTQSGSESLIGSMSMGSSLSSALSSAQQSTQVSSQQFSEALRKGVTSGSSDSENFQRLSSLGQSISSMNTSQAQRLVGHAKEVTDGMNLSKSQQDAVVGALAASAGGSLGAGAGSKALQAGLNAGLTGQASAQSRSALDSLVSNVLTGKQSLGFNNSDTQALNNQLAESLTSSGSKGFARTWEQSSSRDISDAATKLRSDSKSYSDVSALSTQLGSSTNSDFKTLGALVSGNSAADSMLNEAMKYAPASAKNQAQALEQRYNSMGMNPDVSRAAARLTALTNTANFGEDNKLSGVMAAGNAIKEATGLGTNNGDYAFDKYSHNLSDGIREVNEGAVKQGLSNNPGFDDGRAARNTSASRNQAPGDSLNGEQVTDAHQAQREDLRGTTSGQMSNFAARMLNQRINNAAQKESSFGVRAFGLMDRIADRMAFTASTFNGAAAAYANTSQEEFKNSVDKLQGMSSSELSKLASQDNLTTSPMAAAAAGVLAYRNGDYANGGAGLSPGQSAAYFAGAATAANAAGERAYDEFKNNAAHQLHAAYAERGYRELDLNHNQSQLYAAYALNNDQLIAESVDKIRSSYADKDSNGMPMRDSSGGYVMPPELRERSESDIELIRKAVEAGDQGASITAPLSYANRTSFNLR